LTQNYDSYTLEGGRECGDRDFESDSPPIEVWLQHHSRPQTPNFPAHAVEQREFLMANHVSSLKRARQTVAKTAVNRANRTKLRGILRQMRESLVAGDAKSAAEQYRSTVSVLDKSVQKGVLHANTASRYKSRLNARLKTLATKAA